MSVYQFATSMPKLLAEFSIFKRNFKSLKCKITNCRSSRPDVLRKKGVLRNFAKLTGKHLCQSLIFAGLEVCNFTKKRLWHRCFPVNVAKFLTEHLQWLLLKLYLLLETTNTTQTSSTTNFILYLNISINISST